MEVFKKIEDALKKDRANEILHFSGYTFENSVKKPSQQGKVIFAKNNIGKKFAIKFYRPTDKNPEIVKDGVKRFVRETQILASLSHKNIVKVYTGGKAKWVDSENKWIVNEGFPKKINLQEGEVLYYIMDFIEGSDVSSIFPELSKKTINLDDAQYPLSQRLKFFEDMVYQISYAMHYYHTKDITHKDIKPDNIRYSKEDSTFIIVDFGFAHHIKNSPQDPSTIIRTEYLDIESISENKYDLNDVGQFSRILLKILPSFKSEYDSNRYQGIESALERGKNPILTKRYKTALDFFNSVKPFFLTLPEWKLHLKLNEYLCPMRFGRFSSQIRIPVSGSILLSDEVQEIIDTPEFQRLRGVRQLGATLFVFPGANNTRFEHSLGTYSLSLKYMEKLIELPHFRELCEPIDETIKLTILSALLHDIGHYPYSHWVEEINFPEEMNILSHEERAKEIICNGELREIIQDKWNVDPITVSNIIADEHSKDRTLLINSFINSVIDIDKTDYLIRDSVHCGVNYGKGIDVERLLDSLYFDETTKKICLTNKGRSSLLSILTCRNIMYQEVYWHKTVRACDAMFKRFFYEYVMSKKNEIDTIKNYFNLTDDHFISKLFENSQDNKQLNNLIFPFTFGGRSLYKPAYVFFQANASDEFTDTKNFFADILDESTTYTKMVKKSDTLAKKLKNFIPGIKPLDIIIEKTPIKKGHEIYNLQGLKLWNIRKQRFDNLPSEADCINRYLENNPQAYIFCNPEYYSDLKKLFRDRNAIEKVFGKE